MATGAHPKGRFGGVKEPWGRSPQFESQRHNTLTQAADEYRDPFSLRAPRDAPRSREIVIDLLQRPRPTIDHVSRIGLSR